MKIVKWGFRTFKIKLTMEVIEGFYSLGYTELQVNRDLCRLMKLPYVSKVRKALESEIKETSHLPLDDIRNKCAEAGLMGDYYSLTPNQIIQAYDGYCKLIYNLGNLYIIAERKSHTANSEPFVFEERVSREDTFKKLKLEVK